ncbi:MAG: hypothetical protein ACE5KE_04920 [Methanosarcinales archaeon]
MNYKNIDFYFILIFLFLSSPKIIIDCARPFYNYFFGLRYKKKETIKKFIEWWEKSYKNKRVPENSNVVYGHTHFLNYINLQEEEIKKNPEMYDFYLQKLKKKDIPKEKGPTLVNISAWVKDTKKKEKDEKYKNVMVASFLYIDEKGFEFFGWDWYEKKIFHIPKEAIEERRENGLVSEDTEKILEDFEWPEKLIKKWRTHFTLSKGWREKLKDKLKEKLKKLMEFY